MNIKGIISFFEEHVEKMCLVLASIVFVWFLLTWVVISPNNVEYEGKKFVPGSIDNYIYENAAVPLKNKLNRPPEPASAYEPEYDKFVTWLDSPLSNINLNIYQPLPGTISEEDWKKDSKYGIPQIGQVTDAIAEHMRAVAYVPTEEITPENPYDKALHEPDDIDMVTVEAKFDAAKLYENFYENYAGTDVRSEWQDPCLAKPIFAAVDLQRQEALPDGSWSDWKTIPRVQIDSNKELFKIIEKPQDLPSGGMKLRLLRYNNTKTLKSLLQPDSYVIASSKEDWFPPTLHAKYIKFREDIERDERRQAAEEAEKERSEKTKRNTTSTGGTRGGAGMTTRGGGGPGGMGGIGAMFGNAQTNTRGGRGANRGGARDTRGGRNQTTARTSADTTSATDASKPKETTLKDIEDEFKKSLITNYTKIFNIPEPMVFWAIDDTIKPDHSYRYRVRLGVFNPNAGTTHFTDEFQSYQDKLILWSKLSNVTEPLEVPSRLYFFPLSVQEDNSVEIKVSKYTLGYWHSNIFQSIKPGENIGQIARSKPLTQEEKQKNIRIPKEINYDTGAILVDVVPVNEWVGTNNLNRQLYNDLLYSRNGDDILRIPVKSRYWAQNLLNKFNEINRLEKEPKEPLREWGAASSLKGRRTGAGKGKGDRKTMESMLQELFQQ
ncbi:MAG: hypothetical protein ACYSSP_02255 [Planctomycetota bacterium]|jgi:hypothetical protein